MRRVECVCRHPADDVVVDVDDDSDLAVELSEALTPPRSSPTSLLYSVYNSSTISPSQCPRSDHYRCRAYDLAVTDIVTSPSAGSHVTSSRPSSTWMTSPVRGRVGRL